MGGIHGFYQIIDDLLNPLKKKVYTIFKIDVNTNLHRAWCRIITFVLVDLAWIFFRMPSLYDGMHFLKGIFSDFELYIIIRDPIPVFSSMGLSTNELLVLLAGMAILWNVSQIKKKVNIFECFIRENFLARWTVYLLLLFSVLIYGIYGDDYVQTQFIYFQF